MLENFESDKESRQCTGKLAEVAFPLEQSDYYQFYLKELCEIDKLKWILSEQIGRDAGISYSKWIWVMNYRNDWITALRASGEKTF